ncbi:hypothetical protein BUALT_Bualt04G0154700 [Buddleja alternifolia]|uniref:Gibberellin-regulated protein 14 n=1 Tax=Buddleja alternifolia TaxID=168488 RepID=A0AAV6XP58_9LAMI|nr:hypothetical protein BUALT_Bualt04G0154700 [Buddleja alternifolia]
MASKAVLLVLACFLLVNTRVSAEWEEEILIQGDKINPVAIRTYKSSPPPANPPLIATAPPPPPPVTAPANPPLIATAPPPPPLVTAPAPPPHPPRNREECTPLCVVRCKDHSRKNLCLRACLTCCERCKCVPPGQYGNTEKCGPCYSRMTTRGGKLKCP